MKPYFSVAELAEIWGQDICQVADCLRVNEVRLTYCGQKADLDDWYKCRLKTIADGGTHLVNEHPAPPAA